MSFPSAPAQRATDLRARLLGAPSADVALVSEDEGAVTYGELARRADDFAARLGPERSLVVLDAEASLDGIAAYLGAVTNGHAVALLAPGSGDARARAVAALRPTWVVPSGSGRREPLRLRNDAPELHPELALLLATSGSTGAPKYVRLSAGNLTSNAEAIAATLGILRTDRALLSLPIGYAYGLSVLHSHLVAGASLLLTRRSIADPGTWRLFDASEGTTVAGVPHGYEILDAIGFDRLPLPHLRMLTQAGGRMAPEQVRRWARRAAERGWKFFVMYGQTEATARITCLPHDAAEAHPDCVGAPLPGSRVSIVDADGKLVTSPGAVGELVVEGPGVMLGYATSEGDLALGRTVERLATGDLAARTEAGWIRITGRRSRFVKPFGLRIGLDELEHALGAEGFRVACGGSDAGIVVLTTDADAGPRIGARVRSRHRLPASAVRVLEVADFPRLPSGKVDLEAVSRLAAPGGTGRPRRTVRDLYSELFPGRTVGDHTSFVELGGDSLTYVEASLGIESILGHLPRGWERRSAAALDAVAPEREETGRVETATALRAFGVTAVVANHFLPHGMSGGAHMLLVVAGFHFARFQVPQIGRTGSARPAFATAFHIALPAALVLLALQAVRGVFDPLPILLAGNWIEPRPGTRNAWFLALLVQVLLTAGALLAIPSVRRRVAADPLRSALAVAAGAAVVAGAAGMVGDASAIRDRTPQRLFWMFALGWLLHAAAERGRRWTATAAAATLAGAHVALAERPRDALPAALWIVAGSALLVHTESIRVPSRLRRGVALVAGASMFIYLTHFSVSEAAWNVGIRGPNGAVTAILHLLLALGAGVAAEGAWDAARRAVRAAWARRRDRVRNPDRVRVSRGDRTAPVLGFTAPEPARADF